MASAWDSSASLQLDDLDASFLSDVNRLAELTAAAAATIAALEGQSESDADDIIPPVHSPAALEQEAASAPDDPDAEGQIEPDADPATLDALASPTSPDEADPTPDPDTTTTDPTHPEPQPIAPPTDHLMLYGGRLGDELQGGDGNDTISGGGGNDFIYGEGGDDWLFGGSGNDELDSGGGNNFMDGGAGDDLLWAGNGTNTLDGGAGDDQLWLGSGSNSVHWRSGEGDDVVFGHETENNKLFFDNVNSVRDLVFNFDQETGGWKISERGHSGSITIVFDYDETSFTSFLFRDGSVLKLEDMLRARVESQATESDDSLDAYAPDVTIHGLGGDDEICALSGHNILDGGAGNDQLSGGTGKDVLLGGDGDDALDGGDGDDILTGGAGADEFCFLVGHHFWRWYDGGSDIITDFHADEGDVLSFSGHSAENTHFDITASGNDTIINYEGGEIRLLGVKPSDLKPENIEFYLY